MMKVGIIAANKLRFSPYAFFYADILRELGIDYEFVVPDRSKETRDESDEKIRTVPWNEGLHNLVNYSIFSARVRRICKQSYDFVIVLTAPNAVFFAPWITRLFPQKYIVDIRDYTFEKYGLYRAMEKIAFQSSAMNVISSPEFTTFLPESTYYVTHNITTPLSASSAKFKKNTAHIIIGYVGSIGYAEQCEKMIELVAKDARFSFLFYGTGDDEERLKRYVSERNYGSDRIRFFGAYKPDQKSAILRKVDILFNCYGNGSTGVRCLLANKLYDGLYYHIPILNSPNTYMDKMSGKLSYALDLEKEKNLDGLWSWYQNLDGQEVDLYADRTYQEMAAQNMRTKAAIVDILKKVQKNSKI